MRFEWDPNKSRANIRKHGVSFETASLVFDDPNHLSIQDRFEEGEERWQILGLAGGITILIVARTVAEQVGEEVIRIISARKATPAEGADIMKASERTAKELKALAELPDSKIDTSDIPQRLDWTGATRGRFRRDIAAPSPASNPQ